MKRQIKFRVWDHKLLKFNYFDLLSTVGNLPVDCIDNVQQFTGLLDSEGKEIYEGDIIKSGNTIAAIDSKLDWNCGCCGYVYGYYLESINDHEIIGNIFENPELIKK